MDSPETRTVCLLSGQTALRFPSDCHAVPGFLTFWVSRTKYPLISLSSQSLVYSFPAGNCEVVADKASISLNSGGTRLHVRVPTTHSVALPRAYRRDEVLCRSTSSWGRESRGSVWDGVSVSGTDGGGGAPGGVLVHTRSWWGCPPAELSALAQSPAHFHSSSHTAAPGPGHQWAQERKSSGDPTGHRL